MVESARSNTFHTYQADALRYTAPTILAPTSSVLYRRVSREPSGDEESIGRSPHHRHPTFQTNLSARWRLLFGAWTQMT